MIYLIDRDRGLSTLERAELCLIEPRVVIDRIIIGPTTFPLSIRYALLTQMKAAGIEDAESKLHISFVPLRPS